MFNIFYNINGVQIRKYNETRNFTNLIIKRFEIEIDYLDNVYLQKLVSFDFINIKVEGQKQFPFGRRKQHGRCWMFIVKKKDFDSYSRKYAEIACVVHDKISVFLSKEYGYIPGPIIMDSNEKVFKSIIPEKN